jgi:hypothetical protein
MTLTEDGESVEVTQSIENIELAYRARADSFGVELKRLREVCGHAVDPGFASHPNYHHAKHLCAWHALGLMRELSDRKITGTKDSAFRVVTGLLGGAARAPDAANAGIEKRCADSTWPFFDNECLGEDRPGEARARASSFASFALRSLRGSGRKSLPQHCVRRLMPPVERVEHGNAVGAGDHRLAIQGK